MPKVVKLILWLAILGVIVVLVRMFVPLPYPFDLLIVGAAVIGALVMIYHTFAGDLGSPP